MGNAILGAVAGAAFALILLAVLRAWRGPGRASDLREQLESAGREINALRWQLDLAESRRARANPEADRADYVITALGGDNQAAGAPETGLSAGGPGAEHAEAPVPVPDRLVLSATLGRPLLKAAAFSHGLRRALSARSRNRIRFEMRQEVRAARKRRRRAVRDHLRETRAAERAGEVV